MCRIRIWSYKLRILRLQLPYLTSYFLLPFACCSTVLTKSYDCWIVGAGICDEVESNLNQSAAIYNDEFRARSCRLARRASRSRHGRIDEGNSINRHISNFDLHSTTYVVPLASSKHFAGWGKYAIRRNGQRTLQESTWGHRVSATPKISRIIRRRLLTICGSTP